MPKNNLEGSPPPDEGKFEPGENSPEALEAREQELRGKIAEGIEELDENIENIENMQDNVKTFC